MGDSSFGSGCRSIARLTGRQVVPDNMLPSFPSPCKQKRPSRFGDFSGWLEKFVDQPDIAIERKIRTTGRVAVGLRVASNGGASDPQAQPQRMVRQVRKKGIRPIRRRFGEEQLDAHAGIYDASQWSRRHRRRSSRGNSNAVGSAGRERETAAAFIPEAFVAESRVAGLGDVAGRFILP